MRYTQWSNDWGKNPQPKDDPDLAFKGGTVLPGYAEQTTKGKNMSLGNETAYPAFGTPGMTLRQCYAMAAMQGLLADKANADNLTSSGIADEKVPGALAECSFKIADAMLAYEESEREVEAQGTKAMGEKQ